MAMENYELRLLKCTLPVFEHNHDQSCSSAGDGDIISSVVSNIEKGAYVDALCSETVKSLLWKAPDSKLASLANDPRGFYSSVFDHVKLFMESGSTCKNRVLLVMSLGVAALLAFWKANVTGPCLGLPACRSLMLPSEIPILNEEDWNKWGKKQLMVDGCDLVGAFSHPQYLILSKILLVDTLELFKAFPDASIPSTMVWWACRVLLANQHVLAERSASLCSAIVGFKSKFSTVNVQNLDQRSSDYIRAALNLEYGLVEHHYGHVDQARQHFNVAQESCGLQIHLTGVLGFRTVHQVEPKAQMVLQAKVESNLLNQESPLVTKTHTSNVGDEKSFEEEDILMFPKLADKDSHDSPTLREVKKLNDLQQAVILALCQDVKKNNPDDEMKGWQMAPYIEAVDAQQSSQFLVKCSCQLLRIRWECTRSRTKQRALLMFEQLVHDICGNDSINAHDRMLYAFCVNFPTTCVLRKEYAEMLVSCGLVREALSIFEELELWNSLIDCYCLLDKKAAAVDLIRKRLELEPEDPRLWCALGDVTLNEDCYVKSWEVSGHRYGRAQRSLGRSTYNRGEYSKSVEHWQAALALNPMHPDGWFALGSAALKARDLDKAVDSFTHAVQLEPENGEAWNNIAAIHMSRKKSKLAFVAFKEALKYKRSSWQMWENYAHVALDVCSFAQVIEAINMVLDLSQGKRVNIDCITRLVQEVETRLNMKTSPAIEADGYGIPSESNDDSKTDETESASENSATDHPVETEWLTTRVGKLISRVVQTSQDAAVWGLLARWHRIKGDLDMCSEALLKQVRNLQGSDWQHNKEQFEKLCEASLQLCDVYMETSRKSGNKKQLYSAQMLLRNLLKQGERFVDTGCYANLQSCLSSIQASIQSSK